MAVEGTGPRAVRDDHPDAYSLRGAAGQRSELPRRGSEHGAHSAGDQHLLVNKLVFLRPDFGALADLLPLVSADQSAPAYAFRAPRRGDIVVFRFPGDTSRDFVKRVVGVPGDTVEIRNGEVFVNGESLHEPYVINGDSSTERPVVVPEESYYVLGDNRRASQDSRDWGTVPAENIIGRGWLRYWPLDGAQVLSSFSAQ